MKSLAGRLLEKMGKHRLSESNDQNEMIERIKEKLNPNEVGEVFFDNGELVNSNTRFLDIEKNKDGDPIGFIQLEDCKDPKAACLNTVISVTPDARGMGLSSMMFKKAAHFFVNSNYEQMIWRVRKTNTPSVKLAKKFGFSFGWTAQDDSNYDIYLVTNPSRFRF